MKYQQQVTRCAHACCTRAHTRKHRHMPVVVAADGLARMAEIRVACCDEHDPPDFVLLRACANVTPSGCCVRAAPAARMGEPTSA